MGLSQLISMTNKLNLKITNLSHSSDMAGLTIGGRLKTTENNSKSQMYVIALTGSLPEIIRSICIK